MTTDIYPLMLVILMMAILAIDTRALADTESWSGSELHAADRYAVAERMQLKKQNAD